MSGAQASRFDTLDMLRGVAALAVVTLHFDTFLGGPALLPHAYLAVDLFFALSGFVLAQAYGQLLAEGWSVREFMIRRFIRLYPLYFLFTIFGWVVLAAGLMGPRYSVRPDHLLAGLGANLIFLPAPVFAPTGSEFLFPALPPAWSLLWELVANLLFAIIAPRLTTRNLLIVLGIGLVLLIATGVGYGTLDAGTTWVRFFGGPGRVLWGFFAGVALQRLHSTGFAFPKISAALLAAILIEVFTMHDSGWVFDVIITLLLPLVVLAGAQVEGSSRLARWLGYVSYALYVAHLPILHLIQAVELRAGFAPSSHFERLLPLIPCLVLPLAVSGLVTRYFDEPVRRRLTRLVQRPTALVAPRSKPDLPLAADLPI